MSANTERLERMAVEAAKLADDWLQDAKWNRERGYEETAGAREKIAERSKQDAEWYRSLIPLVEAGERAQWQPIETAPKDGTKVLLYKPDDDFWCSSIATARWWAKKSEWLCTGSAYFPAPTHWQPLPPAPKGGA